MKTIPFDVDKAKAGAKVVTREGFPVRILCYDRLYGPITPKHSQKILAFVRRREFEETFYYDDNGHSEGYTRALDLMLEIEPKIVPFTFERAKSGNLVGKVVCHKTNGGECIISGIYPAKEGGGVLIGLSEFNFKELLNCFTFKDGLPCGMEEF